MVIVSGCRRNIVIHHRQQIRMTVKVKHGSGFFLIVPRIIAAPGRGIRIDIFGYAVLQITVEIYSVDAVGDDKFYRRIAGLIKFNAAQTVIVLDRRSGSTGSTIGVSGIAGSRRATVELIKTVPLGDFAIIHCGIPAFRGSAAAPRHRHQSAIKHISVVEYPHAHLFAHGDTVGGLAPFAGALQRRQQHCGKYRDNRNHNQKFDKSKAAWG